MNELERLKTQVWELNGVNEFSWKPNIADHPPQLAVRGSSVYPG